MTVCLNFCGNFQGYLKFTSARIIGSPFPCSQGTVILLKLLKLDLLWKLNKNSNSKSEKSLWTCRKLTSCHFTNWFSRPEGLARDLPCGSISSMSSFSSSLRFRVNSGLWIAAGLKKIVLFWFWKSSKNLHFVWKRHFLRRIWIFGSLCWFQFFFFDFLKVIFCGFVGMKLLNEWVDFVGLHLCSIAVYALRR